MLSVSLDFLRAVSCVPNAASGSGLSPSCVRNRTKTIPRNWQHWVHKTQDEDNPETLAALGTQDTGRRQSRDTGSRLSSSCVLCTQCCQCLWIVFVLCLVYPMLPVSLDYLRPVSFVPNVASFSGFSKKWWVESDFKAPNLPLSLRFKGSGCHCNSI
jgi:hypothetical protein